MVSGPIRPECHLADRRIAHRRRQCTHHPHERERRHGHQKVHPKNPDTTPAAKTEKPDDKTADRKTAAGHPRFRKTA